MNAVVSTDEEVPRDLVSATEASLRTGLRAETIRTWYRKGKLRAWRRGLKRVRVSLADVVALANAPYEVRRVLQEQAKARTEKQREAGYRRAIAELRASGVRVD